MMGWEGGVMEKEEFWLEDSFIIIRRLKED